MVHCGKWEAPDYPSTYPSHRIPTRPTLYNDIGARATIPARVWPTNLAALIDFSRTGDGVAVLIPETVTPFMRRKLRHYAALYDWTAA